MLAQDTGGSPPVGIKELPGHCCASLSEPSGPVPRARSPCVEDFLDVRHTQGTVLSTVGDKALPSRPPKATEGGSTQNTNHRHTVLCEAGRLLLRLPPPPPLSSPSYSSNTPSTRLTRGVQADSSPLPGTLSPRCLQGSPPHLPHVCLMP